MDTLKTNILYYGDNLEILRKYIPDSSIDLIYLDPPFNSKKDYKIIFKEPTTGREPEAQIKAFNDIWHWDRAAEYAFHDIVLNGPPKVGKLIDAVCDGIGRNDITAYLVMMTIRLLELHRVLKDTGSLYLHCDPTSSHYLKLVLDQVFGAKNFLNEIVWAYGAGGLSRRHFPRKHDILLSYAKSESSIFNASDKILRVPYASSTLEMHYKNVDEQKRRYRVQVKAGKRYITYADEGKLITDVWTDIGGQKARSPISPESLGYPTQKPEALLERIISASSNEGDKVLDPFCGCGTALVAAQRLNRRWIGIDVAYLAIDVTKKRLQGSFSGIRFEVITEPNDVDADLALARQNSNRFQ